MSERKGNPSFGLSIWGPLVPANDCKACMYTLAGFQILGGLMLFRLPGRNPPLGQKVWKTRLIRTMGVLSGTYLMTLASLEIARLQLPNDPWIVDAARARKIAEDRGEKVSRWFGPKDYKPVEYKEWRRRMDLEIFKMEKSQAKSSEAIEFYENIHSTNKQLGSKILNKLKQENSANLITNPDEGLQQDIVWDPMDSWESLKEQTDIVIRLIPHSREIDIDEDTELTIDFNIEERPGSVKIDDA